MRTKPLICTPITADNYDSYVKGSAMAKKLGSDLAEFRIDHFQDITSEIIKDIISNSELPLIVTNRNRENGGKFVGGEDSRLQLLYSAIESKPSFIDIELMIDKHERQSLIQKARLNNVGIICSFHDFRGTPTIDEMVRIYSEIKDTGADVAKMVYTPTSNQDSNRIISVTDRFVDSKSLFTIFGMGHKGQNTRLLTPLLGGCLVYSSLYDDSNNELGQVSLTTTKKYFEMMESKGWSNIRNKKDIILKMAEMEFNDSNNFVSIDRLLK